VKFIRLLIIRDPISSPGSTFIMIVTFVWYCFVSFFRLENVCCSIVFLFWGIAWRLFTFRIWLMWFAKQFLRTDTDDAPKKGQYRRKTAGNSSRPKPRWVLFDHYPIVNSRQGSHGPLQTRPSIQAQSKTPHHRQHLCLPFNWSLLIGSLSIKFIATQFSSLTIF
jgi:hypothetical protein